MYARELYAVDEEGAWLLSCSDDCCVGEELER